MIITFCGHRDFFGNTELKERLVNELVIRAKQTEILFCYSGGYGGFDRFAAYCVKEAQRQVDNIRTVLSFHIRLSLCKTNTTVISR